MAVAGLKAGRYKRNGAARGPALTLSTTHPTAANEETPSVLSGPFSDALAIPMLTQHLLNKRLVTG